MDAAHERDRDGYIFRKHFNNFASRLTKDEAFSLSYIYGMDIPSNRTEALPMILHVFTSLERKGLLTPDHAGMTFLLQDMLKAISRHDIRKDMSKVFLPPVPREPRQKKIPFYFKSKSHTAKRRKKITDYFNSDQLKSSLFKRAL